MKKLVGWAGALALFCTSGTVMAAGTYFLTEVGAWNSYTTTTPTPSPVISGGLPLAGTATVTGGGAFTATGVQFSFINANATFNYTSGSWSGTVGGGSVTHTETCIEEQGTPCTGGPSGLTGVWVTGLENDGSADPFNCYGGNLLGVTPVCNGISVTENPGVSLIIREQSRFAAPFNASGYQYTFTAVPVPAAVWLFGSALGLLGWVRRRSAS